MPQNNPFLLHCLQDAVVLNEGIEREFRRFSQEGDDEEVQKFFLSESQRSTEELELLKSYSLTASDGGDNSFAQFVPHISGALSAIDLSEERILNSLVAGFAVLQAKQATFNAIGRVASMAGNTSLAQFADGCALSAATGSRAAWHFLPTRSKIAFNMATAGEVDPAIETKTADDRIGS